MWREASSLGKGPKAKREFQSAPVRPENRSGVKVAMQTVLYALKFFWEGLGHVGRARTLIDLVLALFVAGGATWAALGSLAFVWALLLGAVIFALVAFALLALDVRRKAAPKLPRRTRLFTSQSMSAYLGPAVLAVVGVLAIGGAAYWWHSIAYRPQDFAWGFGPPKNQFFLGLSRSGSDEPWVMTFQVDAQNLTGEPILNVSSYIRSDLNNRQIPVVFNIDGTRVPPTDTDGIARDGYFQLVTEQFRSPDLTKSEGLPIGRFRSDVGPFTFVFEYDGKKYSRHFSLQEIDDGIAHFIRTTDEQRARLGPKPGVMRKQPKK